MRDKDFNSLEHKEWIIVYLDYKDAKFEHSFDLLEHFWEIAEAWIVEDLYLKQWDQEL